MIEGIMQIGAKTRMQRNTDRQPEILNGNRQAYCFGAATPTEIVILLDLMGSSVLSWVNTGF